MGGRGEDVGAGFANSSSAHPPRKVLSDVGACVHFQSNTIRLEPWSQNIQTELCTQLKDLVADNSFAFVKRVAVEQLNRYFCKMLTEPIAVAANLGDRYRMYSQQSFISMLPTIKIFKNFEVKGKGEEGKTEHITKEQTLRLGVLFMESPLAITAQDEVFAPLPIPEEIGLEFRKKSGSVLNIWTGAAIPPETAIADGDLNHPSVVAFVDVIKRIWCRGDEKNAEAALDWLAFTVAKPGIPIEYALVLQGAHGTAKGWIFEKLLAKILGPQMVFSSANRDNIIKYQSALRNRKLVVLDELVFPKDGGETQQLKELICKHFRPLREMYRRSEAPVWCPYNTAITSNNSHVVAACDTERRYFVLNTSDEWAELRKAGRHEEYEKIIELCIGGAVHIAKFFYTRDLSNFNVRKAPRTRAYEEQILHNLPVAERAVLQVLQLCPLSDGLRCDPNNIFGLVIEKETVLRAINDHIDDRRQRLTVTALTRLLKRLFVGFKTGQKKNDKQAYYLPPIEDAALSFAKVVGVPLESLDLLESEEQVPAWDGYDGSDNQPPAYQSINPPAKIAGCTSHGPSLRSSSGDVS